MFEAGHVFTIEYILIIRLDLKVGLMNVCWDSVISGGERCAYFGIPSKWYWYGAWPYITRVIAVLSPADITVAEISHFQVGLEGSRTLSSSNIEGLTNERSLFPKFPHLMASNSASIAYPCINLARLDNRFYAVWVKLDFHKPLFETGLGLPLLWNLRWRFKCGPNCYGPVTWKCLVDKSSFVDLVASDASGGFL